MDGKLIFTTESVEPRHRLDLWRSTIADSIAPVEIRDCDAANFEAEIVGTSVGDLTLTQSLSAPQTFERTQSLIKKSCKHDYIVSIQLDRTIAYSTNGREHPLVRDGITLFDMARQHSCKAVDGVRVLDVHIPRAVMDLALGPVADAVGMTIGPDNAIGSLIRGFFRNLMAHGDLLDHSTSARMAAIGVDLLAAGFADSLACEARTDASSATLVYRAKAFIEDRLGDPTLQAVTIAAALDLPVRCLEKFFAAQELSVDGYLWERRLAKACMLLRDPAHDRDSIADIGTAAGFLGASNFAQRFRQRFGMTPSDCRARARLERVPCVGYMQ